MPEPGDEKGAKIARRKRNSNFSGGRNALRSAHRLFIGCMSSEHFHSTASLMCSDVALIRRAQDAGRASSIIQCNNEFALRRRIALRLSYLTLYVPHNRPTHERHTRNEIKKNHEYLTMSATGWSIPSVPRTRNPSIIHRRSVAFSCEVKKAEPTRPCRPLFSFLTPRPLTRNRSRF